MTTTNPEELRLRDAVVRLAESNRDDDSYARELDEAVDALRDYRAKSSSPPPRVEPPEEFWGVRFHWLVDEIGVQIEPFEWHGKGLKLAAWSRPGGGQDRTRSQMAADGWRYHSPCKPDTRIEPTDADPITPDRDYCAMDAPTMLRAVGDDARKWADAFMQITAKYDHPIDAEDMIGWFANAIEHSGDVRRWRAEKAFPAPPSQIEVSDEAMARFLDQYGEAHSEEMADMVRAALAHFSPTPTAWTCAARKQSLPESADCDWPFCGCDEKASSVIAALEESGALKDDFRSPTQPAPVQQEITDDEVWELFCASDPRTMVSKDRITHFARSLIDRAKMVVGRKG